jgi:hypothetical protein
MKQKYELAFERDQNASKNWKKKNWWNYALRCVNFHKTENPVSLEAWFALWVTIPLRAVFYRGGPECLVWYHLVQPYPTTLCRAA